MPSNDVTTIRVDAPEAYLSRELSWLGFARRVLAIVEDHDVPLLERVKFAGIMGMLHDEFFMKRMSGLKRQIRKGSRALSIDGRHGRDPTCAWRRSFPGEGGPEAGRDGGPAGHDRTRAGAWSGDGT